jgi:hypothetical protein
MHAFVAGAMYGPAAQTEPLLTGEALSLLPFHQPSTNLNASSILNFYMRAEKKLQLFKSSIPY